MENSTLYATVVKTRLKQRVDRNHHVGKVSRVQTNCPDGHLTGSSATSIQSHQCARILITVQGGREYIQQGSNARK